MTPKEEPKWKEFQSLMAFLDDMRNKGLWVCRRLSEQEQKHSTQLFTDINWNAQEKMVRRYLGLPSLEQTSRELDVELARIRKRNEEERLANALPGVVQ